MRALACDIPHEASKEFLIDYFEECRMKYIDMLASQDKQKKGRQVLREDRKMLMFVLCHFRIQGVLFTKIGVD